MDLTTMSETTAFSSVQELVERSPLVACLDEFDPPYSLVEPQNQTTPFIFSSPHSGRRYPSAFLESSRLGDLALRHSEDSFVDELFAAAPSMGAPLLAAEFPRAFCDVNREPFELDPRMFNDVLPSYVNTRSVRVASGLGTVARVVADGAEIYKTKLCFDDVLARIDALYKPYHAALARLIERTQSRFGIAILIDCHSMPSRPGNYSKRHLSDDSPADFVLGDRFGSSCSGYLMSRIEEALGHHGYIASHNEPYAGGYSTQHYGQPNNGIHALQIEINRGLYMDEIQVERSETFDRTKKAISGLIEVLSNVNPAAILPPR